MRLRSTKAFSLIEMLVVISIIAVLAGITAATVSVVQKRTKAKLALTDIQGLYAAFEQFKFKYGEYPNFKDATLFPSSYYVDEKTTTLKTFSTTAGKHTLSKKLIDRLVKDKMFSYEYSQMDTTQKRGSGKDNTQLMLNDPYGWPYILQLTEDFDSGVTHSDGQTATVEGRMPGIVKLRPGVYIYSAALQEWAKPNKNCVYLKNE